MKTPTQNETPRPRRLRAIAALVLLMALPAEGADQTVLGSKLVLRNPGPPERRMVILKARERASDDSLVGDPVESGATLVITAEGGTATSEKFDLATGTDPATGKPFWSGDVAKGFKYRDTTGVNGPVQTARINRTGGGSFLIDATIQARLGEIAVLPPDEGTRGCALLELGGGDSYSVAFADGTIKNRGAKLFQVRAPKSEGSCLPACGTLVGGWGSTGSGDGQLKGPNGIAVDASGNVFVGEFDGNRVQEFTGSGAYVTKWGSPGSGNGQFTNPGPVAVDGDGNVIVGDYNANRIQKFTKDGVYLGKWGSTGSGDGQFHGPVGIAVDASGNVFVADQINHRVQKFTSAGAFVTKWGSLGTGDGQFNVANGVAVDADGNVFVVDFRNHRVQKFTNGGTFVTTWGGLGDGDGEFRFPSGIAIDAAGNVFVSDLETSRVQKFTNDGDFVAKWGSVGSGPGELSYPVALATDGHGNVLVAEYFNDRVQKFACPE
jgi:NHL repeat